jgi:2Fe-2S ferredoxin
MTVITFIQYDGAERMVDGDVGLSLMESALKHDVPGIDADCGGGAICGTCHCFVEISSDLPAPDSQETAMLGLRPDRAGQFSIGVPGRGVRRYGGHHGAVA